MPLTCIHDHVSHALLQGTADVKANAGLVPINQYPNSAIVFPYFQPQTENALLIIRGNLLRGEQRLPKVHWGQTGQLGKTISIVVGSSWGFKV
jgi:hypothetical protein